MKEFWDLYDEDRRPLHRLHIRGRRLRPGTYHLAVGIWTVNDRNEILLTLRAPEKPDWPNRWENTAGSVLAGEDTATAAVRELREETGLLVKKEDLVFLGAERSGNTIGDCYIVRKTVELSDLKLQPGETCDARLVTLETLDDMIRNGLVAPPVSGRLVKIRPRFEAFLAGKPFPPDDLKGDTV